MSEREIGWWSNLLASIGVSAAFAAGAAWATVKIMTSRNTDDIESLRKRIENSEAMNDKVHQDMLKMIQANASNHAALLHRFDAMHDTLKQLTDEQRFNRQLQATAEIQMQTFLKILRKHNLSLVRSTDIQEESGDG